ncbi:hypothetical protein [Streptomyces malaysiensis]|nr:hypothetical protein [Streptomyces malaysiensis]
MSAGTGVGVETRSGTEMGAGMGTGVGMGVVHRRTWGSAPMVGRVADV